MEYTKAYTLIFLLFSILVGLAAINIIVSHSIPSYVHAAGPDDNITETNPAIITYEKAGDNLVTKTTHKDPVVKVESQSIKKEQAKIDKYNAVIELWEAKKAGPQSIIDKYNSLEGEAAK